MTPVQVRYSWTSRHEVDAQRGLLVLFAAGATAAVMAGLSAVRSHKQKLRQFLAEVAGDGAAAATAAAAIAGAGPGGAGAKQD